MLKKILRFLGLLLGLLIIVYGAYDYWNMHINDNFGVVAENKVYKSRALPFDEIEDYIKKYKIKTVIDFRDSARRQYMLDKEKEIIDNLDAVKYINIRSGQIPSRQNLRDFFKILDDKSNYPVLMHCYHGLGRTMLYVSLYRIEYENMDNETARHMTRPYPIETILHHSSFAGTNSKGRFLVNYLPRSSGENATVNHIK